MGDIGIEFPAREFRPNQEFVGTVTVAFPGRYDGVVINTQVLDSNELVTFKSCNGKQMSRKSARLFVARDDMPDGRVEFAASLEFVPDREHEVKFRASIIEQHKEIESAVVFAKLLPA